MPVVSSAIAGDGTVVVSWDPVADAAGDLAGYNVYVDGTKANLTLVVGESYEASGLTNGTEYGFSVSSVDDLGNESAQSDPPTTATPAAQSGATRYDFDGDRRADIGVYDNAGRWDVIPSATGTPETTFFGLPGDLAVPNDYDGDGVADVAIYRNGGWFVEESSTSTLATTFIGLAGDLPVPADYDGDGETDEAVYRNGAWFVNNSGGAATSPIYFGLATDVPVVGDYDGDGRDDVAVYRDGAWFVRNSADLSVTVTYFGLGSDIAAPGDYDGDGVTDYAVFRNGTWFVKESSSGDVEVVSFGLASDQPVVADFDGDGADDFAVFRNGGFYVRSSETGSTSSAFLGFAGYFVVGGISTGSSVAVNTAPTIADIGDVSATVGVALDPTIQAVGDDVDLGDVLTYSADGLPAGLGIDPDSGEITGTPTEDGVFVVTVTVSDGTESADTAFTLTVDLAAPGVPCSPVSTLPCADLLVALPFSLDFDGSEGGLADTGFTLVDAPSDRGVVDQSPAPATPTFADVPGYEPGLLTVAGGTLTIDATKGIQYATPNPVVINGTSQQTSGTAGINAQLNSLGVAVAGGADGYELSTTLIAPAFDVTTGGSQQAGLTWFVDEDTYIKLVVVRVNNTTNRVQLAVETLDAPTADDPDGFVEVNSANTFADGQDVALRMVIDAVTNEVTGFYSVAGTGEVQVDDGTNGSLIVPAALLDGVALDAGLEPTVNAGLFATKRSAPATDDVSATFADFAVTSVAAPVNTAPTIADIDDASATQGVALDPTIQAVGDDVDLGDVLTYSADGLPAGLAIEPDSGEITGTPTEDGAFVVTVTVSDGTDSADTAFTLTVDPPVPGAPCYALSTLACDDVTVVLPFSLDFTGTEGGLGDVDDDDTGFTMAQVPSNKEDGDPDPTVAEVPGYVAAQLDVDGGALTIGATNGLAFRQLASQGTPNTTNSNSQQNTLGVGFDADAGPFTLQTTVDVDFPGNNNFQQAGLWFGIDEDNYVKLVARETSDGGQMTVELLREINADEGTDSTVTGNLTEGPITLIMEVDPAAGTVTGSYLLTGAATPVEVATYSATPQSFFDGVALPDGASGSASFGGVFASARRASVANRIDAVFTDFSIDGDTSFPGNTAPEVLLTGDRTLFNGQDTIIPVDSFDDDGDTITLNVTGLPTGLTFDGDDIAGTVAADADLASPYTVEVTGDDGTDTTIETFTIDVIPAVDGPSTSRRQARRSRPDTFGTSVSRTANEPTTSKAPASSMAGSLRARARR